MHAAFFPPFLRGESRESMYGRTTNSSSFLKHQAPIFPIETLLWSPWGLGAPGKTFVLILDGCPDAWPNHFKTQANFIICRVLSMDNASCCKFSLTVFVIYMFGKIEVAKSLLLLLKGTCSLCVGAWDQASCKVKKKRLIKSTQVDDMVESLAVWSLAVWFYPYKSYWFRCNRKKNPTAVSSLHITQLKLWEARICCCFWLFFPIR